MNLDETGLLLIPSPKNTWAEKGSKQVSIVALEDKRGFTITPVVTALGQLVGKVQVIWQGKTTACEPKLDLKDRFVNELSHTHRISLGKT